MIEHEPHSHPHHTGISWLDLTIAGSAIFISIVSLIISIHHGRTMEKLVAANEKQVEASTLPIIRFTTGNVSENVKAVHFDLEERRHWPGNHRVVPSQVEWSADHRSKRFSRPLLPQAGATGWLGLAKCRFRRDPSRRRV